MADDDFTGPLNPLEQWLRSRTGASDRTIANWIRQARIDRERFFYLEEGPLAGRSIWLQIRPPGEGPVQYEAGVVEQGPRRR